MLDADHPLFVRVVDRRKITDYLLSQASAKADSRYRFFTSFGFDPDDPQRLIDAIHRHPETGLVTRLPDDTYGQRWNVAGPISTPDGRDPVIRTGWIKGAVGPARFITAIPKAE